MPQVGHGKGPVCECHRVRVRGDWVGAAGNRENIGESGGLEQATDTARRAVRIAIYDIVGASFEPIAHPLGA